MSSAVAPDRVRVLLADDATEIRRLVRLSLELDGRFDVVAETDNGSEAVELARRLHPDVAVVDLAMPVLDGLQAIPLIRDSSPATRVVVLSAFSSTQMSAKAVVAGADLYLEKGLAAERLAGAIAEVAGIGPAPATHEEAAAAAHSLGAAIERLTHEMNSPLAIALGFTGALRGAITAGDADGTAVCLDAVERSLNNMRRLLDVLLDARTVAAGQLKLTLEPVDVGALVCEAVEDLSVVVERPFAITVNGSEAVAERLAGAGVVARADAIRLRQVVVNLVGNADKFAPQATPIDVSVAQTAAGGVEVVVRDHGPGVPADQRTRLFRRFGRLERDRATAGTGLGLYLAREIAVAHGGDLTLEDPEQGSGCRFVLRLPPPALVTG